SDTLVVYYHGTLKSDGSVFDSAYERSKPFPFQLEGVIPGWQKGVPGMKIGGVRRLTVPAALGYGPTGSPPKIPANADLVFVIEVVDTLRWEDLKAGDGDEVWGMCVAVTTFSAKDKDGKEVDGAPAAHPPRHRGGTPLGAEPHPQADPAPAPRADQPDPGPGAQAGRGPYSASL